MNLLIADDDRVSLRLLRAALEGAGHVLIEARSGDEAWEFIRSGDIRLAVIDWMMPGLDGVEICHRVRMAVELEYVYIIVVTARDAKADIVAALDAGADDCMTKPFSHEELNARVRTGERFVLLQRALRETQEELRLLATRDELTRLWNRAAVLRLLEGEINRCRRDEVPLTVAMVDIDHFKVVNDRLGHQGGDLVLAQVASRMEGACRSYDRVGRYGGEELIAIIPECEGPAGAEIAERLRAAVCASEIHTPSGSVTVTVSLGCASTADRPLATSTDLIRAADRALYASKDRGRNRVTLAKAEDFAEPG